MEDREKYLSNLELTIQGTSSADSWNELSTSDNQYHDASGDHIINWKTEGYSKLLDILMVIYYFNLCLISFFKEKNLLHRKNFQMKKKNYQY